MPGVGVSKRLWIEPAHIGIYGGMDQWLLAVTSDPAAKGLAKDLEVAGAGPVHCHFSLTPFLSLLCVVSNVVFLN